MRVIALLILIGVAFAGCAEAPAPGPANGTEDFDDVDVEVTDDTGAILGVVVDESITPVVGATIVLKLPDGEQDATSDESGRFAFSRLPAGTYFLDVAAPLHVPVQTSATVVAGEAQPDIVRVQLQRLYSGDPFTNAVTMDGFFQCSQANVPGYLYSSSPCHSVAPGVDLCDTAGACLPQNRDFHADVGDGWQTQVYEMTWKSSLAGTSERMGMSVSTYKPERNTNHWFASVSSTNPMRFQLDRGVMHDTAQEGDGPMGPIPDGGMTDMSMYMSVRSSSDSVCALWCVPPGVAIEQQFTAYLTQFYYLPAPEGWSVIEGDEPPF